MTRAVFLDRDGVLIADADCLTDPCQIRILPGVPSALRRLKNKGFLLVIVTNQAVVARGLATEEKVRHVHQRLNEMLLAMNAPAMDAAYFCPHHPQATLSAYRGACECRKPNPGMLLRAAKEFGLNLGASFMVGDRPSDILAGARAGCRTIWVQTGRHADPPIETADSSMTVPEPTFTCADLAAATEWILQVA